MSRSIRAPILLLIAVLPWTTRGAERQPCPPALDDLRIRVLGEGYAQLQNLKDSTGNVGIGLGYQTCAGEGSVLIKKGTMQTIEGSREVFGRFLLSPSAANVGAVMDWKYYPWRQEEIQNIGLAAYVEFGAADWVVPDPEVVGAQRSKNAIAVALGLGPSMRIKGLGGDKDRMNEIQFVGTVYAIMRGTYGDMRGDPGFRTLALGTGTKNFWGAELSIGLRINDIEAIISYPFLVGGVNGLTRGQLLPSVGFRAGIDLKELPRREKADAAQKPGAAQQEAANSAQPAVPAIR